MNKKDPLRTIKYFTSKDRKDSKDSKVFYCCLSNIDIPL